MDADRPNRPSRRTRVKVRLVAATLGALSVIAALTIAVFQPANESKTVADLQGPATPATRTTWVDPTLPSGGAKAVPTEKAQPNGGWTGNWIGTGPFKAGPFTGGWPPSFGN